MVLVEKTFINVYALKKRMSFFLVLPEINLVYDQVSGTYVGGIVGVASLP